MYFNRKMTTIVLIGAGMSLPFAAKADELNVSMGLGYAPDYVGSDDYILVPLPSFSYESPAITIRSNGLGLEADLIKSPQFGFGPIIRYDGGRNSLFTAQDPVIRRLGKVNGAIESGAFFEGSLPLTRSETEMPLTLVMRVSAVSRATRKSGGILFETSIGLVGSAGKWTVGSTVTSSLGTARYQNLYYGISAGDSQNSGLSQFHAGGGVRDVGLGVFATRSISERLTITPVAAYSRIVGDVADSPIVDARGSKDQFFAGISLGYRVF